MSLKETLQSNNKISAGLAFQIAGMHAGLDDNAPVFGVVIKCDPAVSASSLGEQFNFVGDYYTARGLSLQNLETLADNPNVVSIEGRRLPEQDPQPE